MMRLGRGSALATLAVADAAALIYLSPHWAQLVGDIGAPHRWISRVGADEAAIALGGAVIWCVAVWLAIGLGAAYAAAAPGRIGCVARYVARRLLPEVLLRAVAAVAGLGVLVSPVAAGAVPAGNGTAGAPAGNAGGGTGLAATSRPAPAWPTDRAQMPRVHVSWPTDQPPARGASAPMHGPAHTHGAPTTARPHRIPSAQPERAEPQQSSSVRDGEVTVTPGDSLWLIAAQRLGPDASDEAIAAAWPRWYAANEHEIGPDPSLIVPGQVLRTPSATNP